MDFNIKIGMKGNIEKIVGQSDTAESFGSGKVNVFATPMMIGLMENASLKAVDSYLPEGFATVGSSLNVKHTAATPVGMKVNAVAELIEVKGKKLTFKVKAFDEIEMIGEGSHERYIIELSKFLDKTSKKSE